MATNKRKVSKEWLEEYHKNLKISPEEAIIQNKSQKEIEDIGNNILTRTQTWQKNHEIYVNNYNNRFSGRTGTYSDEYVSDSGTWLDTIGKQKNNFELEASSIKNLLEQYKSFFSDDFVKGITDTLDNGSTINRDIYNASVDDNKYWSQFESAEAYNAAARFTAFTEKYKDMSVEDEAKELDRLDNNYGYYSQHGMTEKANATKEEMEFLYSNGSDASQEIGKTKHYQQAVSRLADIEFEMRKQPHRNYEEYFTEEELEEKRKLEAEKNNLLSYTRQYEAENTVKQKYGSLQNNSDYEEGVEQGKKILGNQLQQYDDVVNGIADKLYYSSGEEIPLDERTYWYTNTSAKGWATLTEDEKNQYHYLRYAQGAEAAEQYLKDMEPITTKRATEDRNERIEGIIKGSPDSAAVLSAISIPTNFVANFMSPLQDAVHLVKGEGLNPNDAGHIFRNITQTIRDTTASEIENSTELEFMGQNVLSNVYSAAMSMGDSIAGGLLLGSAYSYVMGSGAASQEAARLYQSGASYSQVLVGSLAAGVAEAFFEKFSLEQLFSPKNPDSKVKVLLEIFKQAGIEASEEVATETANTLTNLLVMGEQSDLHMLAKEYEESGYSPEEALKLALKDKGKEIIWAGIQGFMSGGMSSTVLTSAQGISNTVEGSKVKKSGETESLIETGLSMPKTTEAYKTAAVSDAKLKKSGKVNSMRLGSLKSSVAEAISERGGAVSHYARKTIESELENAGVSESEAIKISELIFKGTDSQGNVLSAEQKTKLQTIDGITEVYSDIVGKDFKPKSTNAAESDVEATSAVSNFKTTETTDTAKKEDLNTDIQNHVKENFNVTGKYTVSETGETRSKSTGEAVKISEVASTKGGTMVLKLEDGSKVNAEDVEFSSEDEAIVYEGVAGMGVNAVTAWRLIEGYDPSSGISGAAYLVGVQEAYKAGFEGVSLESINDTFASKLSYEQLTIAHQQGVADAEFPLNKKRPSRKGKVILTKSRKSLTKTQRAQVAVLDQISRALGVTFHMYESKINAEGKRVATVGIEETGANGWYDPATGEIWIDLNAGMNGEGTILFTATHELTHFIKDWSLEKYGVFSDFLLKNYAEKGVSVDQLIKQQQEKAKRNSRTLSRDEALDEVIADSCETFLRDSDAVSKIAALKAKDESVANKIKEFISNLMEKVRALMSRFTPDSTEGKLVSEMNDALEELYSMWTEALTDAGNVYKSADQKNENREGGDKKKKYSLEYSENGKPVVVVRDDITKLASNDKELVKLVKQSIGKLPYVAIRKQRIRFLNDTKREVTFSRYTKWLRNNAPDVYKDKMRLFNHPSEVVLATTNYINEGLNHPRNDNIVDFARGELLIDILGNQYLAEVVVGFTKAGICELHDVVNMTPTSFKYKARDALSAISHGGEHSQKRSSLNNNISHPNDSVNNKNSDRDQSIKTDREILLDALESAVQNEDERMLLRTYRGQKEHLETAEARVKKLNAEIKELSFAPGKRETERIRNLTELRDDAQRVINRVDKRLLSLEAAKPLRDVLAREKKKVRTAEKIKREKMRAELKEKSEAELADTKTYYRDMVKRNQQKARDSKEKAISDLKAEHKAQKQRAMDRRDRTILRAKIKDKISALNKLLTNPTKDKHIPLGLQKPVVDLLDAIDIEPLNAEERIAKAKEDFEKYTKLIAEEFNKTSPNMKLIEFYQKKQSAATDREESLGKKLKALEDAYGEIKSSEDPIISQAYVPEVEERIKAIRELVGDTDISDMTMEQLQAIHDAVAMIDAMVRNANKTFLLDKKATISGISEQVMSELGEKKPLPELVSLIREEIEKFGMNNMIPVYFFEMMGSETLTKLYNNLRVGEDTYATDVAEAKSFSDDTKKKYGFDSWDFDTRHTFKATNGNTFEIDLEQIMSLYAYSRREQARGHLRIGGFVFDKNTRIKVSKNGIKRTFLKRNVTAHNISDQTFNDIISVLTESQRKYVEDMQNYLSETMGTKGNDVTRKLYGIDLFKEKFYFPLRSAERYMPKAKEQELAAEKGMVKISAKGFTNAVIKNANNAVVLSGFSDVWAGHVDEMSMYHALVLPLEDFSRVYGYKSRTVETEAPTSVNASIAKSYGDAATKYIDFFLERVNGGVRSDPVSGIVSRAVSKFKKSAVFVSASVVIQQPSAIARSLMYINPKYFTFRRYGQKNGTIWTEMNKYAPITIIKEIGRFDTHTGANMTEWINSKSYDTLGEKIKGAVTDSSYRDEVLSKGAALADKLTWIHIWEAVKNEVEATSEFERGSEDFLKAAGERFTEVVTHTQVYDSVFSRSAFMSSKNEMMKMATAFMAEPTLTANIARNAYVQLRRGNKSYAVRAIGAVSSSIILNSILVSLVYAARDDDEDESYLEKYIESLTAELLEGFNPLTYFPFVKDVFSLAQGYKVERSDMSIYSDLISSFYGLFNENKSAYQKLEGFCGSIANLFGLPLENLMRDAGALYNLCRNRTLTTMSGLEKAVKTGVTKAIPKLDKIIKIDKPDQVAYEAVINENERQIERSKSRYKDEKKFNIALKEALRTNDIRIKKGVKALVSEDVRDFGTQVNAISSEGHFDKNFVSDAVYAEYEYFTGKLQEAKTAKEEGAKDYRTIVMELKNTYRGVYTQDEIISLIDKLPAADIESTEEEKAKSIYKRSQIGTAVSSGDIDLALDIVDEHIEIEIENGKEEKEAISSVKSSITTYLRPLYVNGTASERTRIEKFLEETGLYDDVSKTTERWDEWEDDNK